MYRFIAYSIYRTIIGLIVLLVVIFYIVLALFRKIRMQFYRSSHFFTVFLRDCGIVLFRRVHVFMPQNVGDDINISRFVIETSAVCAA